MNQKIMIRDTSVTVVDVLRLLASGHLYEQILKEHPALTLADILGSIQVATDLLEQWVTPDGAIKIDTTLKVIARNTQLVDVTKLRESHPRAYEKWETAEDNRLVALFKEGRKPDEIASLLGRQRGAIVARLKGLGLTK